MSSSLQKKQATLASLVEVAVAINASLEPDDVLPRIMDMAQRVMNAEAASVALVDDVTRELVYVVATGEHGQQVKEGIRLTMGQGVAGWVAQNDQSTVIADVPSDPRFNLAAAKKIGHVPRSMVCVPMRVAGKVIGILQALDPLKKQSFDQDDGEFFEAFASLAATAINNARLHKALLKQQSEQKEQEFARQIQQGFLPREMPAIARVTLKGCNQPARYVSGDFYDVIQLSPTKVAVIVGDVTGKGIASSLYMVRCLFDTRRTAYVAGSEFSPGGILTAKNETLGCEAAERLAEEMAIKLQPHPPIFLAMLCVTFDAATGELRYANAGMPDPILRSADGIAPLITSGGPALGMLPGFEFAEGTRTLAGGETLVLFTDGLSEARNLGQVEFGYERISESLALPHDDAATAAMRIAENVLHFTGSAERHDDLTFMVLHYAKC